MGTLHTSGIWPSGSGVSCCMVATVYRLCYEAIRKPTTHKQKRRRLSIKEAVWNS